MRMLQFDFPSANATPCFFLAGFVEVQFLFRKSDAPDKLNCVDVNILSYRDWGKRSAN